MVELDNHNFKTQNFDGKSNMTLLVCDESAINCATLRQIRKLIENNSQETILMMPGSEYQKGKRGWAKAHILASVVPQIKSVLTLDYKEAIYEINSGGWGKIQINGNVIWDGAQSINSEISTRINPQISETSDQFDLEMIARANRNIETSNCWLDPAGVVFVKDGEVLMESTSTSFNGSNCREIPVNLNELSLNPGERMLFCDSLHAERVGISEAAKRGINLKGTTMYVTKFPCRSCAQSAIAAGVSTIIFEQGSYGLIETADLFGVNKTVLKRVIKD